MSKIVTNGVGPRKTLKKINVCLKSSSYAHKLVICHDVQVGDICNDLASFIY